jgi:VCBS repeat-containing protein
MLFDSPSFILYSRVVLSASAVPFASVDSLEELAQYDVVVLGNTFDEVFSNQFWSALRQYVESDAGGVVSNGWTSYSLGFVQDNLDAAASADYDAAVPVTGNYAYTYAFGPLVSVTGGHAITDGLTGIQASGYVTAALALDDGAVSLATLFGSDSALAYLDQPGHGHSVYLGFHFTDAQYRDYPMAGSLEGDRLLEQAVNWAGSSGTAITEDSKVTIAAADLLANDTDPDTSDVLSIDSVSSSSAAGAAVSLDAAGNVFYDATASAALNSLAAGESRTDSFTYRVADGHGGFDTATVAVTVEGRNDAPQANPDVAGTDEDHALSIDVLANDTDPDTSDTHTVDGAVLTDGLGDVSIVGNQVVYDPGTSYQFLAEGESATAGIAYTMSDNHGSSSSSNVSVTIDGVNDAPVANADARATDEERFISVNVLANDTDADTSDTHTVDSAVLSGGSLGSVVIDGNAITFDPGDDYQYLAQGETATVAIDYSMSDNHGLSSSSTLTITVFGLNDDPDAVDDAAPTTDEDTPITISAASLLANDTDADTSDVLTVSAVSDTSTLGASVFIDGDGNVRYDPTGALQHLAAGVLATDTFSYTVDDGNGGSDSATVTLTVAGVNDAPVAGDDAYQLVGGALARGGASY